MAQDLIGKRRNLATNTVTQATLLVNALIALQELQAEYAQCGTFVQTDFDGTSLAHLTPALINAVFAGAGVVDSLGTWYANNTATGSASVANKQNLLQMRQ